MHTNSLRLLAIAFTSFLSVLTVTAEDKPPNIVVIISDDHGFNDYGFMGHPHIKTPHIDKLASESKVFTRGYVSTPLCCPSLTTMLTGLYSYQHGYTGNDPVDGWSKRQKWLAHYKTLPQLPKMLQEKGYLSLHTGKFWQEDPIQVGGFTHSMGKTLRHGSQESLGIGRDGMQPVYDFIDEAQDKEKPFMVWYAPFLPHTPHNPPARLENKYKGIRNGTYFAMVDWLDETCGQLLGYLEDKGLDENTVVLYISDNGWPGPHKVYPSELGMRTPIMIKWPGKVTPNMDVSNVASNIDLAPTILSLAGLQKAAMMQGIDLLDTQAVESRKFVFGDNYHHDMAAADKPEASLRARVAISNQWKLISWQEEQPDLREIPWLTPAPKQRYQLFNLQLDPFEKQNLAEDRPEIVEQIEKTLDAWWVPNSLD